MPLSTFRRDTAREARALTEAENRERPELRCPVNKTCTVFSILSQRKLQQLYTRLI